MHVLLSCNCVLTVAKYTVLCYGRLALPCLLPLGSFCRVILLPNVNSRSLYAVARPSVTLVRHTQPVKILCNVSKPSVDIHGQFYVDRPREPLGRGD